MEDQVSAHIAVLKENQNFPVNDDADSSCENALEGKLAMSDSEEEEEGAEVQQSSDKISSPNTECRSAEENESQSENVSLRNKIRLLADSESEDQIDFRPETQKNVGLSSSSTDAIIKNTQRKKFIDSEDEGHNDTRNNVHERISNLVDSDSEPDLQVEDFQQAENDCLGFNKNEEKSSSGQSRKIKPLKRPLAKAALDDFKAIRSETQRMAREPILSIPYHKPKQHSLKEFLNRRNMVPQLLAKQPTISKSKSLKMTSDELEVYAKYLEDRAKEAEEFFLNDSSDNEKEEVKNLKATQHKPTDDEKINLDESPEIFQEQTPIEEIVVKIHDQGHENREEIPCSSRVKLGGSSSSVAADRPLLDVDNLRNMLKTISQNTKMAQKKLQGNANMMIDLETGKMIQKQQLDGPEQLFLKFLKHTFKSKIQKPIENLQFAAGTANNQSQSEVSPEIISSAQLERKPGEAYFKLQAELKDFMLKKRKEEFQKKLDCDASVGKNACSGDEQKNGAIADDQKEIETDEEVFENDNIGSDEENQQKMEEDDDDSDDGEENEDDYDDKSSDADDELDPMEDEDNDEQEPVTVKLPRKRIIAQEDSDDELLIGERTDRSLDIGESNLCNILQSMEKGNTEKSSLWDTSNHVDSDEHELLGLCTGTFATVHAQQSIPTATQNQTQNCDENEMLFELSSRTFNNSVQQSSKIENMKIRKCKNKRLHFSDDESGDEDEQKENFEEVDTKDRASDYEETPLVETYVEYDSEENEIEVEMTKMDRVKIAKKDFVENEAELSESEWGSADEDEKDLDRYDIELGDEDQFDREKLQSELGKIHMRRVLDDDIRQVKKLQEIFFEDEEFDGVGRQRQFRWENSDDAKFDLKNPIQSGNNEIDPEESDEENNEEVWRKMRYERSQMLTEKKSEPVEENSSNPSGAASTLRKITILRKSTADKVLPTSDTSFLISRHSIGRSAVRGSFLVRDQDVLRKLATITKVGIDGEGTVNSTIAKARNLVFASLSPSVDVAEKSLKRKSLENDEGDYNKQQSEIGAKKIKLIQNMRSKKRLIDHLT